jgi:CelD/BcsL family acetyltransferase involved in cellulose biosynthesis
VQTHQALRSASGRGWRLSRGALQFELVTDEARLLSLEAEWDRLWARSADRRYTNSFAWRATGWRTTGRPRRRRPCVLVMRRDGEAVLIWPLAIRRRLLLWRIALALGPEYTEYDPVLVAAGPEAEGYVRQAFALLRRRKVADIVNLRFVRHGETVHAALADDPRVRVLARLPSRDVGLAGLATWEAYWRTRGGNVRAHLGRHGRRLDEKGEVTFALVEGGAEFDALVDWTIGQKLAWVEQRGLENDFLATPEFPGFLKAIARRRSAEGTWVSFVLALDGKPLATHMGVLDETRFEGFIIARDPSFAKYSVGTMVTVRSLKWLHERGLDCDLRIGAELHKREWATGERQTLSWRLTATLWGEAFLVLDRALGRLRTAARRLARRPGTPAPK